MRKVIKKIVVGKIKEIFEIEKTDKGKQVIAHKVFPEKEDDEDDRTDTK